ncbi:MAG: hypothetical protein AAF727_06125 [Pseudomonadota bacterium]
MTEDCFVDAAIMAEALPAARRILDCEGCISEDSLMVACALLSEHGSERDVEEAENMLVAMAVVSQNTYPHIACADLDDAPNFGKWLGPAVVGMIILYSALILSFLI